MITQDWSECFEFSSNANGEAARLEALRACLPGVVDIKRASSTMDKSGIDYVVKLRRGAEVYVDIKERVAGCSKYWTQGPEIALEEWSVYPDETNKGRAGWTLDESKKTHYVLYSFDRRDTDKIYVIPFQLLRAAFRDNLKAWKHEYWTRRGSKLQRTHGAQGVWCSLGMFVPAAVVLNAIRTRSVFELSTRRAV